MKKAASSFGFHFTLNQMAEAVKNEFSVGSTKLVKQVMNEFQWEKVRIMNNNIYYY